MKFKIALLSGDGIGPEVTEESLKVLDGISKNMVMNLNSITKMLVGFQLTSMVLQLLKKRLVSAWRATVLFGSVGGPKWDDPNSDVRPEDGILKLRKELDLFANIRPAKVYPALSNSSPLKKEILENVDFIIIRELTSGLYFGEPKKRWVDNNKRYAVDTLTYNEDEVRRVVKVGFEMAKKREKKLHSLDKMNVMASSRLWRKLQMKFQKNIQMWN